MAGLSTTVLTVPFLQKQRLDSWKEIALYLDRGVRTVQRWERDLGLPVRRIGKSDRGPVFGYRHEIDRWLEACARNSQCSHELAHAAPKPEIQVTKHNLEVWNQVQVSTESIRNGTEQLHKLIEKLQSLMRLDSATQL
jgi:hypothetical protein